MPTYEYACRDCGHVFEIVQSMKDDSMTICPECGGELRKVFHAAAISFKGSGFYATDSRKKPSSTTTSGDKKPETSTSEKSESSESKSEKAPETKAEPAKSEPKSKSDSKSETKKEKKT